MQHLLSQKERSSSYLERGTRSTFCVLNKLNLPAIVQRIKKVVFTLHQKKKKICKLDAMPTHVLSLAVLQGILLVSFLFCLF